MAKAGSNIYKRKDGRYEGRILAGKTVYQKPRYIYVYARTLREVKLKMKDVTDKERKERRSEPQLLGDAAGEWLLDNRGKWKATTFDTYSQLVDLYIVPILGNYRLEKITGEVLEAFAEEILRTAGDEKRSDRYRKYICAVVKRIICYQSNKHRLDLPLPQMPNFQICSREVRLPDEKTLQRLEKHLLEHIDDDVCLGILLARYTGIRIGELCALQWKDIDLEN